jgi:hypothetical protein
MGRFDLARAVGEREILVAGRVVDMKLWELPRDSKLLLWADSDGKPTPATYHHVDGMYSLCTLADGQSFFLRSYLDVVKVDDHYELVPETAEEGER